jgi:hypothetical protein
MRSSPQGDLPLLPIWPDTVRELDMREEGNVVMTELLTVICTLALMLIGIAILLQITSLDAALGFVGRAVAAVVLMIVALCILKGLWVGVIIPWLSSAFAFLTTLTMWVVIAIVGVIALSMIGRVVLRRIERYLPLRRNPLTGNVYEIHDAKEEKD